MARPSKLTPEFIEAVASLVRGANLPVRAAIAKGVARSTFFSWTARGRAAAARRKGGTEVPAEEQPYLDLVDALDQAESENQAILVNAVFKGALENPKLALDLLRHRYGEWSEKQRHEVSGPGGGPLQIEDAHQSLREQLDRLAARLTELRATSVTSPPAPPEEHS